MRGGGAITESGSANILVAVSCAMSQAAHVAAPLLTPQQIKLNELPPLSLYLHIPWCVRKCPYCDFNSHEAKGGIPEAKYINALIADLDAALPNIWGRRVHTISKAIGACTSVAKRTDYLARNIVAQQYAAFSYRERNEK